MNRATRTLRTSCAVLSLVCLMSVAACRGTHHKKKPAASSSAVITPTPTPTTAKPRVPAINPLTGGRPSNNGVVAVKIDDTASGRPPVNLDKANIVYIEQVEGGLTRLLAIYNSQLPTVEPVRSTRASDPELVAQYGPIAYVASGGAPNPLQVLDRSNLKTSINDRGGPGFTRDSSRPMPYNLSADLALAARALKPPKAKNVGFSWSARARLTGAPRAASVRTVVGGTPVRFDWNAQLRRYVRVIDGSIQHTATGALIATPNVIVQFCKVTVYPQDIDTAGNPSQFTHTLGSGRVVIFRNGVRIEGTWSRPNPTSPTSFKSRLGKPLTLTPGGAWVVLVARNAPLSA